MTDSKHGLAAVPDLAPEASEREILAAIFDVTKALVAKVSAVADDVDFLKEEVVVARKERASMRADIDSLLARDSAPVIDGELVDDGEREEAVLDGFERYFSLEADIDRNPKAFKDRIEAEREALRYGNACGWDREKMIAYCLAGKSGWLGRKVFERSFDDGSMRRMAETYDRCGRKHGI